MLLVPSVSAQDDKGKKVDYTGTQELDISVGLPYGPLFRDASIVGDAFAGFNFISPSDIVTGENKTVLPTFRAEYGYNVLSWLSLGAGVNYSYGSYRMLYKEDNSHAWDEWTVGVGLGIVSTNAGAENAEEAAGCSTRLLPTFDLRLIGLTVGQKLYGRFEVGTLNAGLVSAGIGYRF